MFAGWFGKRFHVETMWQEDLHLPFGQTLTVLINTGMLKIAGLLPFLLLLVLSLNPHTTGSTTEGSSLYLVGAPYSPLRRCTDRLDSSDSLPRTECYAVLGNIVRSHDHESGRD
jgi:hypothetical protein